MGAKLHGETRSTHAGVGGRRFHFRVDMRIGSLGLGLGVGPARGIAGPISLAEWVSRTLGLRFGDCARIPATTGGRVDVRIRRRGAPPVIQRAFIPTWVAGEVGATNGNPVEIGVDRDGAIRCFVLDRRLEDIVGMLRYDGPPVTIEQMNEAIADEAVERFKRSC